MKKLAILFTITLLPSIALAKKDFSFPSYRAIVEKFAATYEYDRGSSLNILYFAKKPSGWYVYLADGNTRKITKEPELFWSPTTGQYSEINYTKTDKKQSFNTYAYSGDEYYYNICTHYGYTGWADDLIEYSQKQKIDSDTGIMAIASAYSRRSMGYLNDQYGHHPMHKPTGGLTELDDKINAFIEDEWKAIEWFKKLYKLHPDFKTIVGSPYIKYCNEHMFSYEVLIRYKKFNEANKFLVNNLYGENYLTLTRNYLKDIPQNSILFTNGDNDTYPVWYLQLKHAFRKDVTVINQAIMQMPEIITALKEGYYINSSPLKTSIDLDIYLTNDYFFIKDEMDSLSFEVFKERMNGGVDSMEASNGNYVRTINSKHWILPTNYQLFYNDYLSYVDDPSLITSDIDLAIKQSYVLPSDVILYDIIATNIADRPIYISQTSAAYQKSLEPYLWEFGIIKRLIPANSILANNDIQYNYIINKMSYPQLTKADKIIIQDAGMKQIFYHHVNLISRYADTDKDKLNALISSLESIIGNDYSFLSYNEYILKYLADLYKNLGDTERLSKVNKALNK